MGCKDSKERVPPAGAADTPPQPSTTQPAVVPRQSNSTAVSPTLSPQHDGTGQEGTASCRHHRNGSSSSNRASAHEENADHRRGADAASSRASSPSPVATEPRGLRSASDRTPATPPSAAAAAAASLFPPLAFPASPGRDSVGGGRPPSVENTTAALDVATQRSSEQQGGRRAASPSSPAALEAAWLAESDAPPARPGSCGSAASSPPSPVATKTTTTTTTAMTASAAAAVVGSAQTPVSAAVSPCVASTSVTQPRVASDTSPPLRSLDPHRGGSTTGSAREANKGLAAAAASAGSGGCITGGQLSYDGEVHGVTDACASLSLSHALASTQPPSGRGSQSASSPHAAPIVVPPLSEPFNSSGVLSTTTTTTTTTSLTASTTCGGVREAADTPPPANTESSSRGRDARSTRSGGSSSSSQQSAATPRTVTEGGGKTPQPQRSPGSPARSPGERVRSIEVMGLSGEREGESTPRPSEASSRRSGILSTPTTATTTSATPPTAAAAWPRWVDSSRQGEEGDEASVVMSSGERATATTAATTGEGSDTPLLSGDFGSTFDGRSTAPTQPPSAQADRRSGLASSPSFPAPSPQLSGGGPLTPHTDPKRGSSVPAGSPRPRTPAPVVLLNRSAVGTPVPAAAVTPRSRKTTTGSNSTSTGGPSGGGGSAGPARESMAALPTIFCDAPHDVPLPAVDDLFPVSATAAATGQARSQGMGSSTGTPSPRRVTLASAAASPGSRSLTQLDSECFIGIQGAASTSTAVSPMAAPAAGSGATSPLSMYMHANASASNSSSALATTTTATASGAAGNATWLLGGSVNACSMTSCSSHSSPPAIVLPFGSAGVANASPGTPPTNSELVRQINQPTTNIKSILRKRAGSAASGSTTHHHHHHGAVLADGDGGTAMAWAGHSGHSRTLSLSLTTGNGSSGVSGVGERGVSSPRLPCNEPRSTAGSASLPDTALRTDFIVARSVNSEGDGSSIGLGGFGGSGSGCLLPHTPPIAFSPGVPVLTGPSLTLSEEASSSAAVGSVSMDKGGARNGVNGTAVVISSNGSGRASGGGGGVLGRPSGERQGRASPSLSRTSMRTPTTPVRAARTASISAPMTASAGAEELVDSDSTPVIRTSDEPPPDIMLASLPKRVHVVV